MVIDEDNNILTPGGRPQGRLAVGGRQPLGYYKDETKTASTFLVIEGKRYSCPGDFAIVEDDGSITLLGRGSVCINTGGEKCSLKKSRGTQDPPICSRCGRSWSSR